MIRSGQSLGRKKRGPPASVLAAVVVILASADAVAVPVSVVGTNDLHGRVERVAVLSGHVTLVRAKNEANGGGVVLVDGGDMFQGTLESNLNEGAAVVAAYNAIGYDAVAVGNHEFDFGPVGDDVVVKKPGQDPRGALLARAAEAKFPFLGANIQYAATKTQVDWPNVLASTLRTVRGSKGVKVGIIGLSTVDTPRTTIYSNVKDLAFTPLDKAVTREATALRKAGADVVVVTAHAGGKCSTVIDPNALESCDADAEIMRLARALPKGMVDVIVAGHTHSTVAHIVNGIAVIESWANGRGFGRVDLDVDVATKAVRLVKVHPPRRLCGDAKNDFAELDACTPDDYEGVRPVVDTKILEMLGPILSSAKKQREVPLGPTVISEVRRGYDQESALGNLFADLMLQSVPGAQVALMNGGGIRANLPVGPLTYGAVFEMMPFDNRTASLTMSVAELRALLSRNLSASKKGGIFSTAGVMATVVCDDLGRADVTFTTPAGKALADDMMLKVVTTDFVADGGDGGLGVGIAADRIVVDEGLPIREHLVTAFKAYRRPLRGDDPKLYDPKKPRLHRLGAQTARCGGP
jgi:5'-nucleotidase